MGERVCAAASVAVCALPIVEGGLATRFLRLPALAVPSASRFRRRHAPPARRARRLHRAARRAQASALPLAHPLQFNLPDDHKNLSHPPYVSRPHKRNRTDDNDTDEQTMSRRGGTFGLTSRGGRGSFRGSRGTTRFRGGRGRGGGRGGGVNGNATLSVPTKDEEGTQLAERFESVRLNDEVDEKMGFPKIQEGPRREGWLVNMHPVSGLGWSLEGGC